MQMFPPAEGPSGRIVTQTVAGEDALDKQLPVGQWGVLERVVEYKYTAAAFGNEGVEVLATPVLIGLVEQASLEMVQPFLEPGNATVGAHIDFSHLAATPVGMKVTVKSQLVAFEGRKLTFKFEAYDEVEKVAEGTHVRVIVDLKRALDRARAKKSAR